MLNCEQTQCFVKKGYETNDVIVTSMQRTFWRSQINLFLFQFLSVKKIIQRRIFKVWSLQEIDKGCMQFSLMFAFKNISQ